MNQPNKTKMQTDTSKLTDIKIGDRVRWDEPMTARRSSFDIDPHSGIGDVVGIELNPLGNVRGLTVAYHPEGSKAGFVRRAYYIVSFTKFEIIR